MITFITQDLIPQEIRNETDVELIMGEYLLIHHHYLYKSNENELVYFLGMMPILDEEDFINSFIIPLYKIVGFHKKILFNVTCESFPQKLINSLRKFFVGKGFEFLFIDSGLDVIKSTGDHIYGPGFFYYYYMYKGEKTERHATDSKPIKDRVLKYSALVRNVFSREFRILMIYELYKRKLLNKGVVTCGTSPLENNLNVVKFRLSEIPTIDKKFIDMLPIRANFPGEDLSDEGIDTYNHVNNPGADSIISLVIESSYEWFESKQHKGFKYNTYWDRPFLTEKTIKSINCKQLPLFMAPKGYVSHLRKIGFDVFDDIINHSYDECLDPEKRIVMIVDELERLISDRTIEEIKKNTTFDERFNKNRENIFRLEKIILNRYVYMIDQFFLMNSDNEYFYDNHNTKTKDGELKKNSWKSII